MTTATARKANWSLRSNKQVPGQALTSFYVRRSTISERLVEAKDTPDAAAPRPLSASAVVFAAAYKRTQGKVL
jgi:hypothetical protein